MKARIVKVDEYNFAAQYEKTIEGRDGKKRKEWTDAGYFGHRLDHAAEFALSKAFDIGEPITPADVRNAVRRIVRETRTALGLVDEPSSHSA